MATHSSILAIDRASWQATVHGVTKSWTPLSDSTFTCLENAQVFDERKGMEAREILLQGILNSSECPELGYPLKTKVV